MTEITNRMRADLGSKSNVSRVYQKGHRANDKTSKVADEIMDFPSTQTTYFLQISRLKRISYDFGLYLTISFTD